MAINVSAANYQAAQLRRYADRLQQAANELNSYKTSLAASWQGSEVPYMLQGVDKTIAQIDAAMRELRNIANDVDHTAAAIKREDDAAAAAARARAEREQRIAAAQKAYNSACDDLAELTKRYEAIRDKLKKTPGLYEKYKNELKKLEADIKQAEKKCDACKNALNAARG